MKARTVGVAPTIPAVIAVEVVVVTGLVLFPPARASWWPAAGIAVAAIAALLVTVHRRSAVGWLAALVRFWRRRRRGPVAIPAAVDIPHGSQLYGVRVADDEAITMIAVSGQAYSPTVLTGAATALTPNLLPLDELTALLDQPGGIRLAGIDIVSSGVRVRRGIGYPPLYSTLLADRPAAGQRSTRLVVRLDIARSTEGLQFRASVGAAAAAATERIVNALLQRDVRANALTAKDLDAALTELGVGLVTPETRPADVAAEAVSSAPAPTPTEAWKSVRAYPGFLTSYYFSPEDVNTNALNQMWALHSDAVSTVSLSRSAAAPISSHVAALCVCPTPSTPTTRPTSPNPLPGVQGPRRCVASPPNARSTETPRTAAVPGRPGAYSVDSGRIRRCAGGRTTPSAATLPPSVRLRFLLNEIRLQPTRISMRTSMAYTRQLLVRAAAVGERIVIYTDNPTRWTTLEQPLIAVVDRSHPPEFVPSIIVSDRAVGPPPAGLASTVISLGEVETEAAPDISFTQTSDSVVRITTAAFSADVHIATFKAEQPFLGQAVDEMVR